MSTKGLANSRWAPCARSRPAIRLHKALPTPAASESSPSPTKLDYAQATQTTALPSRTASEQSQDAARARAELSRYTRIVRRMKWKHPFLDEAYRLATGAADDVAEAELMFKLDFHEYYGMLERALVHLQLVFGIVISGQHRDLPGRPKAVGEGEEGPAAAAAAGAAKRPRRYAHSYHANVLASLDSPANPLHGALGGPDVRRALGRAKDLRNRWKNADEAVGAGDGADRTAAVSAATVTVLPNGKHVAHLPLESYDLSNILGVVHDALDRAYLVADDYLQFLLAQAAAVAGAGPDGQRLADADLAEPTEEDQWEFFVDAMDWEAI
ncbi:hypothetical protein GGTG_06013 [Gaeumannomyces tritici R3-111a-1]|uniref:Uncharacterized protein n=1 Tax=Gaeumannomyces tritici (strain R3-111a-1) TaxID=644352 RepID=J3NXK7_GAET3|nr:hypothetical protein GGTG_06013 [Gaeumannomyces tritici R3-111a-1]EJT76089.1 hypothetical protein GGTG_06013 [Gaeumannomyces tritici R3-111a-1]